MYVKIRHPDWLTASTPQKAIDLFNQKLAPERIAGWLIVTGLRHPLRAVYGSDLRAVWALLRLALKDKFADWWWNIRFSVWPFSKWLPKDELEEMYGDREQKGPGSNEGGSQSGTDPRA